MKLNSINLWSFLALIGLLGFSNLLIYVNKKRFSSSHYLELSQRMRSWWIIVISLIAALSINVSSMIIFFMFISYLALKEYFTIIPTRPADRRIIFIAYLCIPLQYLWVYLHWYGMFVIFIPIYMFLLIPMRMVTLKQTTGFLRAIGTIQWGIMLTVYCLSYIAYLGVLPTDSGWRNTGISLMIYLIALTQLNDVSQYIFGKCFGRKKMIPSISPNKTFVGFFGGLVTTVILALLFALWFTPFSWVDALGAGILIAVTGFSGDLTMSAVKRDLNIKDTGQLLPGHGGILDRLDSIIFTAPLFFHYVRYLYY